MANLPEITNWDIGVYMIEAGDDVSGGIDGNVNKSLKNLVNRTAFLKNAIDSGVNAGMLNGFTSGDFAIVSHLHDDRYYTEAEVDSFMSTHNHDNRYYTETEVNNLLGSLDYYSTGSVDALLTAQTHDNRYYTETEMDSFLGAKADLVGGKVPTSQLPDSIVGSVQYQGTWNASTNTPAIPAASDALGNYYKVSVAGSTNIDGEVDWKVGDWIISDGSIWSKVDNTETVTSVAGRTGNITLTTTDVAEGSNQYYTDERVSGHSDVIANTTARHTHSNITILNNTTASFTSALETKLNGIETGATGDMSASEILNAIKTVDGSGSGLDADTVDGYSPNSTSAIQSLALRDSSGDITARLFRSEYDTTNSSIGYIMTQIDTATNNYIRPSTPAQIISGLNLLTATDTAANSNKLGGYYPNSSPIGNTIALRNSSGDLLGGTFYGTNLEVSHMSSTRNSDTIFYSSTGNRMYKNTATGFKASLGLKNNAGVTYTVSTSAPSGGVDGDVWYQV